MRFNPKGVSATNGVSFYAKISLGEGDGRIGAGIPNKAPLYGNRRLLLHKR